MAATARLAAQTEMCRDALIAHHPSRAG
jgi:hypothetical protein